MRSQSSPPGGGGGLPLTPLDRALLLAVLLVDGVLVVVEVHRLLHG